MKIARRSVNGQAQRWAAQAFLFVLAAISCAASITLAPSISLAETVNILSYNAGLLHKAGVDFVPCVKPRTPVQVREVLSLPAFSGDQLFVATLQEVWTERAFNLYTAAAKKRGLQYEPKSFSEIQNNGQLILTNLPILEAKFVPFTNDSHVARGLRIVDLRLNKKKMRVVNVHTTYSDSKRYSALQIEQFTDLALYLNQEMKKFKGDIVVTGDFNAGPNVRYSEQAYDPAKLLWFDWLEPMFRARGFTEAIAESDTWDEANPLVATPTAVIKLVNTVSYGIANWEEKTSRLDHIFVSKRLRVLDSRLVLKKPVDLNRTCADRSDKQGFTHLSDHYGILAQISNK